VTSARMPVSSRHSRTAHWAAVSPMSCAPPGSTHWPVSRRRWSRMAPVSSTTRRLLAGMRVFALGAVGSLRYSMRPTWVTPGARGNRSRVVRRPDGVEAGGVLAEPPSVVGAAQVEHRVGAGGLAPDVRVDWKLVVVQQGLIHVGVAASPLAVGHGSRVRSVGPGRLSRFHSVNEVRRLHIRSLNVVSAACGAHGGT
jgi:hypothetical protein